MAKNNHGGGRRTHASGKELRSNARNPLQNKAFSAFHDVGFSIHPAKGSWRFVVVYNQVLFTRIFLRITRVPCLHSASRCSSTFVTFFPARAHMLLRPENVVSRGFEPSNFGHHTSAYQVRQCPTHTPKSHTSTFQLLDQPWSQVSSLFHPRFLPSMLAFNAHRAYGSASQFVHEKKFPTNLFEYALGGARTHETDPCQARG